MKKKKVKLKVIPFLVILLVLVPILAFGIVLKNTFKQESAQDPEHVTEEVINDSVPVVNTNKTVINPYTAPTVTVGKNYYDYQGEEEAQKKSIIIHDNTYIQNTGIDYIDENVFEVVSILEGTVITVKDDETLGKTIEIKHDNNLISTYQSLSEITVKKGDIVTQGQVIGKSGTNELDKDLGNHLHFEIYDNGQSVNPNNYLNKEVEEKKN